MGIWRYSGGAAASHGRLQCVLYGKNSESSMPDIRKEWVTVTLLSNLAMLTRNCYYELVS